MHPGLLHPQYRFSGPSPLRSSGELCGPPPGFWPRTGGFSEAKDRLEGAEAAAGALMGVVERHQKSGVATNPRSPGACTAPPQFGKHCELFGGSQVRWLDLTMV